MPRYEVMKPKRNDYYVGEPIYYSTEWHPTVGAAGDVITSDSDTYVQKLKPKTIYIPRKKKSSYIKYTSPRYVRKEPVKVIRTSNGTYPVVHEYKARSSKHLMKPVEVITKRPYLKHRSSTTFIEDTTSFDEHSVSQFSNMSIDVSCDMSAINRDVEAILQQYEKVFDDTLMKEFEKRTSLSRDNESILYKSAKSTTVDSDAVKKKKITVQPEKLTPEQIKILSMDKPPIEKLIDIPIQYLKPRLPPYLKEKKMQASETKKVEECVKTELNTDDLLKGLFQDMASKGLTGNISEYITRKTNIETNESKLSITVGTQTIQKSEPVTTTNSNNDNSSSDQNTVVHTNQIQLSPDNSNSETSKLQYSMKYGNINNLDQLVDEAIKFDTSIVNSNKNNNDSKCYMNLLCPNCIGSGDNKGQDLLVNNELINYNQTNHIEPFIHSPNSEKIICDLFNKELNQSVQLRECLSDLTHSRNQDRLDYKSKHKYNSCVYNDIDNDKKIIENNSKNYCTEKEETNSSNKTISDEKFCYNYNPNKSAKSSYSYKTQPSPFEAISQEVITTATLEKQKDSTVHSKTVFGLPSLPATVKAKTTTNTIIERNIYDGKPIDCRETMAAGDSSENQRKIIDLIKECFSTNENDKMDGISDRMTRIDSTLCVEIMRKLTDTLMRHEPNLLSSENVYKSVHLNILKQLRIDHLRHIQQEIKHIEDLDQFLHNFGLNNQAEDSNDKVYNFDVNQANN